jgi:hypothetical protein
LLVAVLDNVRVWTVDRGGGVAVVRVPLLVLGGVVALLAAGCDTTPKPAPPIKVSPSPSVDAKAKVEADYLAYWAALKAAHEASDPSHPDLMKHAAGVQLKAAQDAIDSLHSVDLVLRGDVAHKVVVMDAAGGVASVTDCIDGAGRKLYDKKTGKLHAPQPSSRKLGAVYQLKLVAGSWLVESSKDTGQC